MHAQIDRAPHLSTVRSTGQLVIEFWDVGVSCLFVPLLLSSTCVSCFFRVVSFFTRIFISYCYYLSFFFLSSFLLPSFFHVHGAPQGVVWCWWLLRAAFFICGRHQWRRSRRRPGCRSCSPARSATRRKRDRSRVKTMAKEKPKAVRLMKDA